MLEEIRVLIERIVEEEACWCSAVENTVGAVMVVMPADVEVGSCVGNEGFVGVIACTHRTRCVTVSVVVVRVVGVLDK